MVSLPRFLRKSTLGVAAVALALAWSPPTSMAAGELDTLDKGPPVGTVIPHPLTATDQSNKVRDFSSLIGDNGVIILFSRSFDW